MIRPAIDQSLLDHPLLGDRPRWTAGGLGSIAVVAVLVLASGLRRGLLRVGVDRLPGVVDQLAGATIVFAVVAPLAGIGYAAANGGPVVAGAIALTPRLAAVPVAGLVADADLAVALAGAALAATVALGRLLVRDGNTTLSIAKGVFDGAVVASVFTALAVMTIVRIAGTAGPHTSPALELATAGTGAATVGVAAVWLVIGRAALDRHEHAPQ